MMSKIIILVFSLFGLFSACVGQYVQLGQCPNVELVANFTAENFLGTWYELSRSDNPRQSGECAELQLTRANNTINVRHSSVVENFLEDGSGTATLVDGRASVTLNISSYGSPIDLLVLLTDYQTFALTYSCENISPSQRSVHIWVLGRQRSFPNEMIPALINTTISNTFGINAQTLRPVQHGENDCLVLPVIPAGQPIILPGQCDPNITVVQNFDVARFTGTWHQISSYRNSNSDGTCTRAQYTLANGVVNVLNSQVNNRNLVTISGQATVSSNDGSARLSVVLNIGGVPTTQNLWILATDYDNYGISYNCENLNNNQKRVYSWIISRTRQLPASARPQVDQVVNSIIDLNYRYYVDTDQSDNGCFFYPEPVPNTPVVFRGQCSSTNVQAMTNFDAVRYMGLWHTIELYPASSQNGDCSNAFYEFDAVAGRIDVRNSHVVNETLATVNAVAVPASTDGSARLIVTFPIPGSNLTVTSDYWVLATDYVNYALVYSCTNLNADEMRVTTWKLSRTKQLAAASQTAIAAVLNTALVLDQRYFQVMDQSVRGCFYYPVPQPGVPVVFPGQCDTTIPVIQNFSFAQFQGTWYQVQSYPNADQPGQCVNHAYSFVSSTQLNLVSTSVNDQFLETVSGTITSSTTDNSGRLIITVTNPNGSVRTIPFWILATDYNNYALAYSCSNIREDFQGVWSLKLSRTRQLTPASNTAINTALSTINVPVLGNQYYEDIDQSDWACFTLPNIPAGQPIIVPGQCSTNITGVQNFNLTAFVGRWRLIESYASNFQTGTCNVAEYNLVNANTIGFTNSQVVNQTLASISGNATVTSTDGSGRLTFALSSGNTFEFYILDTDYNSYALAYGCDNVNNNERRVFSWKLSRQNTLSQAAVNNINAVINTVDVLNNRFYYVVDRSETGCFYFPTPDSNSPVRFRGRCNQNIPVVTNFNATRYLGLWHDIESYPGNFQTGTCNNALYSPGNDVDVYNTQVINETLYSILGSASLQNSTDGSARLDVTFNVGGVNVTTNYWILATDYDTYSFVYTCETIDDEYIRVASWKLSRTKSLPTAAATAINTVMSTIPVLDQRYFVTRDQSPDGCFYYPEPQPGVPVVFPGQCDDSVVAVPNFNMSSFSGVWYEIQAYPKNFHPGHCINHEFTMNGTNVLESLSTAVRNQRLNQIGGRVTFSSTNGSGRLVLSIISASGSVTNIPFWILATDYTNYALAYSCSNINSDYREVFSWKLSRTRQLTPTANTSINNAISNVTVLDNIYFEDIEHTDSACFYLPDLAPGDLVTLPGQCDTNIRGMPNFNLTRYAGRWRLVESYGSRFQTGTCNVARYSLENSNTISVTNAQVVNQQLASISGSANITSTDGSGLLLFTLEGRVPVFEYYVLDTDYDSYALGYGCTNIDSETRQVLSWKMSRYDTLTPAANANINRIIDSIDVLHQPYYYSVDRSEAGCFYFPTPNTNTSVRFRGQCNQNMPVVNNFDVARYLGLWHDIQSYPMPYQGGSCPNAFYGVNNDSTVSVYNTHVVGESLSVINGFAVVASTDGSARLNVTFNILGNEVTTNYWVLATDYVNYAFVYSCTNIDDEYRSVFSWKLSRTKTLTPASNTAINSIMNNYNILDQRYYMNRDQSPQGCFYYPEPEPGVPVVFPGQCDETIAAVPGFSMNAFQGVWYEIAAYPREELPGQCVSHEYSLSSTNTLLLDSLSVFNQTLSTIQGQVSFSSTDGSGRLIVNLNVSGQITPVPYWILSTDYDNYALAYSCVNLNSDYRGVWSWKLSRTRQLTNASNTAINTAISNINVLDNTYYEDIQQTNDACFYLPELGPTEPVIFPGQCDPNIPVLQNFNSSRYLGRWRLIESYYTAFQEGSCNTAEYSAANDGSITVFNTRVVNEQLSTITGRAVPASNDGSGRLVVTFPSTPTPMDYWILDTDYDSYALVYTCQNINSNEKRVWSWKLSRTNTLTPAATTAINQIVNRIDVLNDRYYQRVDRTDAGCFYYPNPDHSTNVVFPGQCNQNIPAVPNFNAALYAGRWFDVESYPTNFQQGTCNTAQYTLNPSGIIDVQNTQIVDQTLRTTSGTAVVASNDGSARLNVTFNLSSGNVTTNYWVLATDYTTYSLVYSCRNIDAETRAVYSWKLGRQPSIPAAANTAINNVINTVQVLSQEYYIPRDHSEQGCFFYPDNNGGDVILNSQCLPDAQVPAITNFNASFWAGTWHEVARFPSAIQNGECGNTQYTLSGNNAFSVLRTFVINETLQSSSTQATVPATGRGVFTANIDGVPFNNVYILATDYTEYALAYACRNINANTKQVYSWKLSRSRAGLSAAANNVINQIVSSNIDLHEPYYRYTGQDNAACFHYPVFDQLPDVIQLPGPCDTSIRAVSNFNTAAYLGRWFDLARYPQVAQSGQCNRAEYSPLGNAISVVNSQVVNSTLSTISGTAVTVGSDGILRVTFVVGGVARNVDYYVLATDYDNYALGYTCINQPNGNRQVGSWKMSRSTTLSSQALAVMDAVISNTQGLREEYYQTTSQSDDSCFYVPEVNPQEAPLFRGQCENITGMPGFNPTRYLGWWHEIERYPVDGGARVCVSSQYEAVGNSIQVVDTSINGLAAVTSRGTATVTNDGRIRRVFGNNRVEDIWVLATDYESYALLYSCENINSEYRRVWSAKHSKARSLTQNAQEAMAPAITSNRVLYPQFYQTVDQSDSACFHYPIQTGAQVILPGQCDQNIPVVQNFNVEEFQGSWYQIQRYDAVENRSCASTGLVYNATSGNINVIAYEVIDGELSAVEGSGRLTSTDGSARLSLVLPVAGTDDTLTTIIYILATDYTDYALAYSCVNVGPFQRQVGAWQLSRERTLSASGAAAINSVVNQRQELHVPYFKQISQTECPEPSSAFFIQSSIIVMAICAMLQLVL